MTALSRRSFVVGAAAALAACATVPRSVDIPRERLEAALARRFPIERKAGDLFTVTVGVPRLQLLPEANRLRIDCAVEATDRIVHGSVHGELALSFGLRYEPADATLRLANVRTERIDVQGLPERWRGVLQQAGAQAVQPLLEDAVLHRFTPEQLARAQGWSPGEIRVTATGVRVELQPPAAPLR